MSTIGPHQFDVVYSVSWISRYFKLKTVSFGFALQSFTIGFNSRYFKLFFVPLEGSKYRGSTVLLQCVLSYQSYFIPGAHSLRSPNIFVPGKSWKVLKLYWLQTELFYVHIPTRSSLHTRSFRHVHISVFRYRLTKNGFVGPKRFQGFKKTDPWTLHFSDCMYILQEQYHFWRQNWCKKWWPVCDLWLQLIDFIME